MIYILWDNALEAAEKSAKKTIDFTIKNENGKLVTIITNSCDVEVDINRIFEHGFSTKTDPSGEGLHQMRVFQDGYQKMGFSIELITTQEDGYFTQVLKI